MTNAWWRRRLLPGGIGAAYKINKGEDGHHEVTELVLIAPPGRALDTTTLRALPVGRWVAEEAANAFGLPGDLAAAFLPANADDPVLEVLRRDFAAGTVAQPALPPRPRTPTTRPPKSGGDGWYREFAAAYAGWAAVDRAPAQRIAEEVGVPVRTVHRWVVEARRRGAFDSAEKGEA